MSTPYVPFGLAIHLLDDIPALFNSPDTTIIKKPFVGKTFMCVLPGGQLYFESKLSADSDGSTYARQDPDGQAETSTRDDKGKSLDADLVNYFVLPGSFFLEQGIRKGDIAVVIFGVWKAFACFGDVGPKGHLGEGSISLLRELGKETIIGRNTVGGGRFTNNGIDRGVITIVFPGSGNGLGQRNRASEAIGAPLFEKLKRQAADYTQLPDI